MRHSGLWSLLAALWMSPQAVGGTERVQAATAAAGEVAVVAISPDGQVLASAHGASVVVWDATTLESRQTLTGHMDTIASLAFSPNGRQLASGSFDHSIRLWDAISGEQVRVLEGAPSQAKSLSFAIDGELLASSHADGFRIWELASGKLLRAFPSERGVPVVTFSDDGGRIGSAGSAVTVWQARSGIRIASLPARKSVLSLAVDFSPDGRLLVDGGTDGVTRFWDIERATLLKSSGKGGDFVRALAFSKDGKTVVIADRTAVRAWDLSTNTMQTLMNGQRFQALALTPDGSRLGVVDRDGSIAAFELSW